jgi:hypothetical protein
MRSISEPDVAFVEGVRFLRNHGHPVRLGINPQGSWWNVSRSPIARFGEFECVWQSEMRKNVVSGKTA